MSDIFEGKQNFVSRWLQRSLNRLEGGTYVAGPRSEENGGWPEAKPFDYVWSNGIFHSSVDNSMTIFFRTPDSVRTEWLTRRTDLIDNQLFFNDVVESLAERLNQGTMSKTKDKRRKFSLNIIRSPYKGLYWSKDDTAATIDYRERMSQNLYRPEWSSYMGIELLPSGAMEDAASLQGFKQSMAERYEDPLRPYLADFKMVKELMEENGYTSLTEFGVDSRDYQLLTSWHGVDIEPFRANKNLATTRFQEPVDGYSLITPAWGEISFYAAVPTKERSDFGEDPISTAAHWGKELYNPSNDVVGIWIKGEIRHREVIKEVLNMKSLGRQAALARTNREKYSEVAEAERDLWSPSRASRPRPKTISLTTWRSWLQCRTSWVPPTHFVSICGSMEWMLFWPLTARPTAWLRPSQDRGSLLAELSRGAGRATCDVVCSPARRFPVPCP